MSGLCGICCAVVDSACVIFQDFVASIVLTVLWLISSSAWAAGLADVKEYTDPAEGGFFGGDRFPDCSHELQCKTLSVGNYGSLNASVVSNCCGFLSSAVNAS